MKHYWRSRDDIFLWTPTHGHTSVGQPVKTYLNQLCVDTGCSLDDLPGVIDDRNQWQEIIRELHTVSTTLDDDNYD